MTPPELVSAIAESRTFSMCAQAIWALNVSETQLDALKAMPGSTVRKLPCSLRSESDSAAEVFGKYHHRLELPECSEVGDDLPQVLVVGAVGPQIHPLLLFEDVGRLLGADGILVLLLEQGQEPPRMQDWVRHLAAMAHRLGWADADDAKKFWSPNLVGDLQCYRKSENTPRWKVAHVREEHYVAVAALFGHVFGHPMSRELWKWKYGAGRGNAVIASKQAEIVAHYGGMYREVRLFGEPQWVLQICDVMVHPGERGVMTRQGPFLLTAATSAELYGPYGFGFPTVRAMQVANKMGLYSEADRMVELQWKPLPRKVLIQSQVRHLDWSDSSQQTVVNELWEQMAADLGESVVGVRHWSYLLHRYASHPHNTYEGYCVVSRLTRRPLGILVMRNVGDRYELLDIIAPLKNLSKVIRQARRIAWLRGVISLYFWITRSHLQHFDRCGAKEQELEISIPTSTWTRDERANSLKERWWLTSGDTDFR
jgi:hypothetical protein